VYRVDQGGTDFKVVKYCAPAQNLFQQLAKLWDIPLPVTQFMDGLDLSLRVLL
jgi:hypothetical protein